MTEALLVLVLVAVGWLVITSVLDRHGGAHPPELEPAGAATGREEPAPASELALARRDEPSGARAAPEDRPPGRARLFAMGGPGAGPYRHAGAYAALGLTTTGFAPMKDRIVEVTALGLDADGTITDEYTTIVHRAGRDPGASFLHGLSAGELDHAPSLRAVAPDLLRVLSGRVVVAHHADLVEQFLDAAFLEAGLLPPSLPALCTFRLGAQTFPTANHRGATLAAHLDLPLTPGTSAAADARLSAALLPAILARHGPTLGYPCPPAPALGPAPGAPARVGRAHRLHGAPAADPWLSDVFARSATSATELGDPRVAGYLEALTVVLTRGHVAAPQVRALAGLLVQAGYSARQVRDVHERLLESLRRSVFPRGRLSRAHLTRLRVVAVSLGAGTYFDDLVPPPPLPAPEPGSGSFARPVRKPLPPPPVAYRPRCGHCLAIGHDTSTCPRRERGPVTPVRPIE